MEPSGIPTLYAPERPVLLCGHTCRHAGKGLGLRVRCRMCFGNLQSKGLCPVSRLGFRLELFGVETTGLTVNGSKWKYESRKLLLKGAQGPAV